MVYWLRKHLLSKSPFSTFVTPSLQIYMIFLFCRASNWRSLCRTNLSWFGFRFEFWRTDFPYLDGQKGHCTWRLSQGNHSLSGRFRANGLPRLDFRDWRRCKAEGNAQFTLKYNDSGIRWNIGGSLWKDAAQDLCLLEGQSRVHHI